MYIVYINFPKTMSSAPHFEAFEIQKRKQEHFSGHSILSKPIYCFSMCSYICIIFEIYEKKMAFSIINQYCLHGMKSLHHSYWFSSEPHVCEVYFLNDEILAINNVTIYVNRSCPISCFIHKHILLIDLDPPFLINNLI